MFIGTPFLLCISSHGSSVKAAVLDRLGQMLCFDIGAAGHVRNGARDLEDPVMRPGAKPEMKHGLAQKSLGFGIQTADLTQQRTSHMGVAVDSLLVLESLQLDLTPVRHSLADCFRTLAALFVSQMFERYCRHLDMDIDPVEQGAADIAHVTLDLSWRAVATMVWIGKVAAGAGVCCQSARLP